MKPQPQTSSRLTVPALHLCIIASAVFFLYAVALPAPFVLDDLPVLADNSRLDNPLAYFPVLGEFSGETRSFGYFTFSLNYRLHGLAVEGYRAGNLVIHIMSAWLVYLLVRNTVKMTASSRFQDTSSRAGFIAGILFSVHPIQTQAVTYLSQRFASLATLLYLLSIVAYGLWRSRNPLDEGAGFRRIGWYCLALVSAFLAMKTKEIAFTLPLVIALYEAIFFRGDRMKRALAIVPFILLMAVIPIAHLSGQETGPSVSMLPAETGAISRQDYLLTQARVIATYGRLLLFPVNQNLDYDYPVPASLTIISLGALIATIMLLLAGTRAAVRRGPGTGVSDFWPRLCGFGIFWFFLGLAVESSVIPIRDVIFEHRLYLPSVGFCLVVAAVVEQFMLSSPQMKGRMLAAFGALLALLSVLTVARNVTWRSAESLWTDVVRKSPSKARPHNNLGLIYAETGRNEQALAEFRFAVQQDPGFAEAYVNLGNSFYDAGSLDEAALAYEKAAGLAPGFAKVHYNLGNLYIRTGERKKAIAAYEKALELKPDYEKARSALWDLTR